MSTNRGVLKSAILKKLREISGYSPNNDSHHLELVENAVFELLGLDRQQCSDSTKQNVFSAAKKCHMSMNYHWGKASYHWEAFENKPFFKQNLMVEIVPIVVDNPELAPAPRQRSSGSYKTFEEKGYRAQALAAADVRAQHPPGAILMAAPKSASALGHGELATALRQLNEAPEVMPAKAIYGMNDDKRMYSIVHIIYEISSLKVEKCM